jgi:hypothetical protein
MKQILNKLKEFGWCDKYIQYLELRKKGLKKQAHMILEEFFNDFQNQKISVRRAFIDFVMTAAFLTKDYNKYLPFNLNGLFKSEIQSWIKEEPDNSIPLRWSYDFDLIKKSLDINPYNQITLDLFGQMLVARVSMNQHELSAGYQYGANPKVDLNTIEYYESVLENIQDLDKKEKSKQIIKELKETAKHSN